MSQSEFNLAKRKNFDIIAYLRLDINKISGRLFQSIVENKYVFPNFFVMDKFSKSIQKTDMIKFFNDKFLGKENVKFTVYVKYHFLLINFKILDVFQECSQRPKRTKSFKR